MKEIVGLDLQFEKQEIYKALTGGMKPIFLLAKAISAKDFELHHTTCEQEICNFVSLHFFASIFFFFSENRILAYSN